MATGGGMPYVVGHSNQVFLKIEDIAATVATQRAELLRMLDLNFPLEDSPAVSSSVAPAHLVAAKYLVREHWFGKAAPPVAGSVDPTGWWSGWQGDAERIVRVTLQRAYQASMGIVGTLVNANDVPAEAAIAHCWPITVFWACGGPFLQGFVSWDTAAEHVTAIISTPGVSATYKNPPGAPPGTKPVPPLMLMGVQTPDHFDISPAKSMVAIGHTGSTSKAVVTITLPGGAPAVFDASTVKGKAYPKGTTIVPGRIHIGTGAVITHEEA